MSRLIVAAAFSLCLSPTALRADTPSKVDGEATPILQSLRELAVNADAVVVAAPLNPAAPARYKILKVLRGDAIQPGDALEVRDVLWSDPPPAVKCRISQALLFLRAKTGDGEKASYSLLPWGARYWTEDKQLYAMRCKAGKNELRFDMAFQPGADWDAILRRTTADVAEVDRVRALKTQTDPHRRNLALLDWVEHRRHEFGGSPDPGDYDAAKGWGTLETSVFDWVLESHIPEDGWSAVKRYAELNHGDSPPLRAPAFGTRAGRALLLRVAQDDDALMGHRLRALDLLANPLTLWPKPQEGSLVEPLDAREQADLLDRLTPLLSSPTAPPRIAVARVLRGASRPADDAFKSLQTDRVLPALTAAYRAQPPGAARDELAEAVCVVGGPANWQQLSGNPDGLVLSLRDPGCREEDRVFFWLAMRQGRGEIHVCPRVVLERLDDKGKVVEKKELPLPATSPPAWEAAGWSGDSYLYTQLALKDFPPGTWQMTVKGVVGKEKGPWSSEPRRLHLAPAPKPEDMNRPPRVVFDE